MVEMVFTPSVTPRLPKLSAYQPAFYQLISVLLYRIYRAAINPSHVPITALKIDNPRCAFGSVSVNLISNVE